MNAAPGPALFAFSPNGATALAYIASGNVTGRVARQRIRAVGGRYEEAGADAVLAIAFPPL